MGGAEEAHAEAGDAHAAVDDHPGGVDAVDAGTHVLGEDVVADDGGAVGPADLAAVGVAGEADISAGGDGLVDEIGVVEEHEFEVVGADIAHGGGDVGIHAAVLVEADEGEARAG